MVHKVKISGARGDWTAQVEGRRLAVLHSSWRFGEHGYHDPMVRAKVSGKRYTKYMAALAAADLVVVQVDKPGTLFRNSYEAVYYFTDLIVDANETVTLTLGETYATPA